MSAVRRPSTAFTKAAYVPFLRAMAESDDPVRKASATVLTSGRDVFVQDAQYSAAANILAELGVIMPVKDRDLAAEEKQEWATRSFRTLAMIDSTLHGLPVSGRVRGLEAGERAAVAEAVAAAYAADKRGSRLFGQAGRPNGVDEMTRVVDRHGFKEGHPRRGDILYTTAFLDSLLIRSVPPAGSPERQLLPAFIAGLARFGNDPAGYARARDKLAHALFDRVVALERDRWPALMPPPTWHFSDFEWERFNISWDGSGQFKRPHGDQPTGLQ